MWRDLTFSRQATEHVFNWVIEVLFLMNLGRQKADEAHPRRIQPATEADSNQGKTLYYQYNFAASWIKAVEFKGECDKT